MRRSPRPRAIWLVCILSVFLACVSAPDSGSLLLPTVSITAQPEDPLPCATADRERARVPGLLAEGRLDRTVRVIQRADALCPKSAERSRADLGTARGELGRADMSGRAMLEAGLSAKSRGDAAGAQRLFDRARVALERETGTKVVARVSAGLSGSVTGLSWSPDGRTLAVAAGDVVSLRETAAGFRETMQLKSPGGDVQAVAFSPDGQLLATGASDHDVRLWSVASGALASTIEGHGGSVTVVAFSPDGRTLASGSSDHTVRTWRLPSGELTHRLAGLTEAVKSLSFSPDGQTLAAGSGDPLVSLSVVVENAPAPPNPRFLRLWNVATGAVARDLDGEGWSLAFSPDGGTLAAGHDDVYLIGLRGAGTRTLDVPGKSFWDRTECVAYAPDGKTLASGADDKIVRLWDVAKKTQRELRGHTAAIASVAFSPDGRTLASGSKDGSVRFWSVLSGELTGRIPGAPATLYAPPIAFSPDGTTLITGAADKSVRSWSLSRLLAPSARKLDPGAGPVEAVTYARDGRTLAVQLGTQAVLLRNLVTEAETRIPTGKEGTVSSIALSPDGAMLATGSNDRRVHLWSLPAGTETQTLTGHTKWVRAVAFSPDGALVASGSQDKSVRVWSVATGAETRLLEGHNRDVLDLAFSPDGATLASASEDRSVSLWNVATGGLLREMEGHANLVGAVAWSPDGRALVTGSLDSTVRVWSAATGTEKQYFDTQMPVEAVAFSSNGATVAASSRDGAVRISVVGGAPLVALRAIPDRNAGDCQTLDATPLIELLGPESQPTDAVCRAGVLTFPFDLCRERFEVPGLLSRAVAGDTSYADP